MKNFITNNKTEAKRPDRLTVICSIFSCCFVMLLLFAVKDFIVAAVSDDISYEIRYEEQTGVDNGQRIYQLYRNGEYFKDVDINKYGLLDGNGNTDYKYCCLMDQAKELTYSAILAAMIILVILIVLSSTDGTPFTRANAKRIRAIGWLQFALAIAPGLVGFLMNFFKFEYASALMNQHSFYMLVLGFIIMLIAQVFDRGVRLQEDVDSIA